MSDNSPAVEPVVEVPISTTDSPESLDVSGTEVVLESSVSEQAGTEGQDEVEPSPTFVVMVVRSVVFELPSPNHLLDLIEQAPPYRTLSLPVGLPEAQAIATALGRVSGSRPSTHELFSTVLRDAQTDVAAVRIVRQERGVYFAELDLVSPRGRTIVDCRVTDAVILALRQPVAAPILCDESLL